jgi:hypothetical protein
VASPTLQPAPLLSPVPAPTPLGVASHGLRNPSDEQAGSLARRLITVQLVVATPPSVLLSRTRGRPIRRPTALGSTVSAKRVDARSRLPQEETDKGRQPGPFVVEQPDEPRIIDRRQLRPRRRSPRLSLQRRVVAIYYQPLLRDCRPTEQAGRSCG